MKNEVVVLEGHIIDSLVLTKVLDTIIMLGGTFELSEVKIGSSREEASRVRIKIEAATSVLLKEILEAIQPHGAIVEMELDCTLEPAPKDGIFPENFYATTHLPTKIRLNGVWIDVDRTEMDMAIRVEKGGPSAKTVSMEEVKKGYSIVTGREGIRVFPLQRPKERDVFGFMESEVSSERPYRHILVDTAKRMRSLKESHLSGNAKQREAAANRQGSKILLAGGPAIVHAGGREALTWLIDEGYVHILFCGNALATHDIEASFFKTSLGFNLYQGRVVAHGHENHLRTINRIRSIGSIEKAVEKGMIKDGIMAACVRRGVQVVMAGTIRDDGPLPGVITDSIKAQATMRAVIPNVGLVLLVASTLHAVATGNLLPAATPTICVDINPAVPTKLSDRGSFQAASLVMDASSFLRELSRELGWKG